MVKLPTIRMRECSKGIVQPVSHYLAPQNSVYFAENLEFDTKIGVGKIRSGSALVGVQVLNNVDVLGIHQFVLTSGTTVLIASVNDAASPTNSDIYTSVDAGANWVKQTDAAVADWTKDVKVRFLTYLDTVVAYNGTDAAASAADGTTWVATAGNLEVQNFPLGDVAIEWNDKVYVAGVTANKNRLYYSSVPSAGVITWAGAEFIDIEPEDGGGRITALAKIPGYLLIFKARSLKRWNGSSTFPDDLYSVGTPSMEGVCECRGIAYFFANNGKGIYATNGGYPVKISKPVDDIIALIPASYYSSVSSHSDGDSVRFSIGDITYDGIVYSNCVLKYNVDTQNWALMSYATEPQMWTTYIASGATYTIFGDDDGEIILIDSGTTDGGTELEFTYQTHELEFADTIQNITELIVHTKNADSAVVMARVDGGDWAEIGTIANDNQLINCNLRGTKFEFRISGINTVDTIEVQGLSFNDVEITENYE